MRLSTKIIFSILAFLTVAALWGNKDGPITPPSKPDFTESAKYKSRALISTALKAPSTAKFCNEEIKPFEFAGAMAWEINGCVDAQNAFGAMLRQHYKVILTKNGEEWGLADLKMY